MRDQDTEWAFIRVLATRGLRLGSELTEFDRSERIRTAILANQLENQFFGNREINFGKSNKETWGQAFHRCYGRSVEQRRLVRDEQGRPTVATPLPVLKDVEPFENDDDDWETDIDDEPEVKSP